MLITPAYTSVFAIVFVILSFRTILLRRKLGIAIGSGDQPQLTRASRAHSNFAEYVPISLLLIYFRELQIGSDLWIHILCILLLVGRIIHAIGVSSINENYRYRITGMILTFFVILFTAFRLLVIYI